MKDPVAKIRNVTLAVVTAALLSPLPGLAQVSSQTASDFFPWRPVDQIEGVWNAKVDITDCGGFVVFSFDAMALFGANGTFHDTNALPSAIRSDAFGHWKRTGKSTYSFAFDFTTGGVTVVRHSLKLAANGATYESEGTGEFYDPNGILVNTACSKSTASRFE